MFVLNGQATKGAEILRRYGLTRYESQAYFSLLLLGEVSAMNLSRQSGVPQSKVYYTLESLMDKGLVEITQLFPKKVVALPFEVYQRQCVRAMREEMDGLLDGRRQLRELICQLQTFALKDSEHTKVFEPSYRRGLGSSS